MLDPPRMTLGPIRGGAVQLGPAGETLALCEGLEDALSLTVMTGLPAWATLGTSNFAKVPVPDIVKTLVIACDGDDAGRKAAEKAKSDIARRHENLSVLIKPAPAGRDWNDILGDWQERRAVREIV